MPKRNYSGKVGKSHQLVGTHMILVPNYKYGLVVDPNPKGYRCSHCSAPLPEGVTVCEYCGTKNWELII